MATYEQAMATVRELQNQAAEMQEQLNEMLAETQAIREETDRLLLDEFQNTNDPFAIDLFEQFNGEADTWIDVNGTNDEVEYIPLTFHELEIISDLGYVDSVADMAFIDMYYDNLHEVIPF